MTCSPSHYIDPNTDQFVFFLLVSLLTFWSPPATAQLIIVPNSAIEGSDVLLRVLDMPPDADKVFWYRGEYVNYNSFIGSAMWLIKRYGTGPANSGRESVNMEGSMLIRNVTPRDSGMYTVVVFLQDTSKQIGFGQLRVYRE